MKIFDRPDSEIGRITRVNEDKWFEMMRPQLLALVNTDYGKDLLCIDKSYKNIFKIGANHVFFNPRERDGIFEKDWEFATSSNWGNLVRSRWEEILGALMWQEANKYILPSVRQVVLVNNAFGGPYYPNLDTDGGKTSCDGQTFEGTDAAWATLRGAAGDSADDSSQAVELGLYSSATTNVWDSLSRNPILFDTSAIPDADTISAATVGVRFNAKADVFSQSISIVVCAPASNIDLVAGDYATFTMTQQNTTDITITALSTTLYNDFGLSATGIASISKTGVTKFGVVLSGDRTNTEPTWSISTAATANMLCAEIAGGTDKPRLTGTSTGSVAKGKAGVSLLLGV